MREALENKLEEINNTNQKNLKKNKNKSILTEKETKINEIVAIRFIMGLLFTII